MNSDSQHALQCLPSSFRDPSGFLFWRDKVLYRQVNPEYGIHYSQLMESGLYNVLIKDGLLIPHGEVSNFLAYSSTAWKVIRPTPVSFISYPYEWSFSQLKDAALLTLQIQKKALEFGMSLKDASAYNVQFFSGKPILIDTLSFEKYEEGKPWSAYRQFCQHFLAPLALMSRRDVRLQQLLRVYLDGIPLDLAATLLPKRAWLNKGIVLHILLHAKGQARFTHTAAKRQRPRYTVRKFALQAIIDDLIATVKGIKWQSAPTVWSDYEDGDSYTASALSHKKMIVEEYIRDIAPTSVLDLGSNTGVFSRIAAKHCELVLAVDSDPACVERNYRRVKEQEEKNILPFLVDLSNPSANFGWANEERQTFMERGQADLVLALALVHHLAIGNNVPFSNIAQFFARIGPALVVEFVPKSDPKVQQMLAYRHDIFSEYNNAAFEHEFQKYFLIIRKDNIQESSRVLYLMRRHNT